MPIARFRFRNGSDHPAGNTIHFTPPSGPTEEWVHVPGPTDHNPGPPPSGDVPPHASMDTMPAVSYPTSLMSAAEIFVNGQVLTLQNGPLMVPAPEEFVDGKCLLATDSNGQLVGTITLMSNLGRMYVGDLR